VFADLATAPFPTELKATLGLVRKLTLSPEEVGAEDIRATLEIGVSEDGVIDAIYVCFAFNLIDRVADALGFDLMDEAGYRQAVIDTSALLNRSASCRALVTA
jgi:alkylhydroperoxidase family enzyme